MTVKVTSPTGRALTEMSDLFYACVAHPLSRLEDPEFERCETYKNAAWSGREMLSQGLDRFDADSIAYAGSAMVALLADVNVAMEAIPDPTPEAARYDGCLDRFIDAMQALTWEAERKNLDVALAWSYGFWKVVANQSATLAVSHARSTKRSAISPELRAMVWDKSGGQCWYCGRQTNPFTDFHVDHVIPVADAGPTDLANLVPSCKDCNLAKGSMHVEAFRSRRSGVVFWFERWIS